jgi:hypothetical protein
MFRIHLPPAKSRANFGADVETGARGAASDPIATHIAARGIDVDGVSPVINFDLPNETSATLVIPGVQNRRQHQRQPLSAVIRLSSAERSLRALLDR